MGVPQLSLPGGKDHQPQAPTPGEVDITIEEAEPEQAELQLLQAVQLGEDPALWMGELTLVGQRAFCVTMKANGGQLQYPFAASAVGQVRNRSAAAAAEVLPRLLSGEQHSIARLSCLHDGSVARANVETMGLKNTGGFLFYDGNNTCWINPGKPEVRDYLCGILVELAAVGFEEILLTDVSYPTVGKLEAIRYGDMPKEQNLLDFLTEVNTALEPYDVTLSIEVPETVLTTGRDELAGLVLADLVTQVDRIYAATTAEQAERLAECVLAESETAEFVPILSGETEEANRYLLVAPTT